MVKGLRNRVMTNLDLLMFLLPGSLECRRSLSWLIIKEEVFMKFKQRNNAFELPQFPEYTVNHTITAKYIGKNQIAVFLNEDDKLLLYHSRRKEVICITNNDMQFVFNCYITTREIDSQTIIRFYCFSSKTKKQIADPSNQWFFRYY